MAKVRAIRNGFYNCIRYVGDEFDVPDEMLLKSFSWVEVLEGPAPAAKTKAHVHPAKGRDVLKPTAPVPVNDEAPVPLSRAATVAQPTPDLI